MVLTVILVTAVINMEIASVNNKIKNIGIFLICRLSNMGRHERIFESFSFIRYNPDAKNIKHRILIKIANKAALSLKFLSIS